MQIRDSLDAYLLQLEADGRSRHTIQQARRHVLLLSKFIGERDIAGVTHEDVARFLTSALAMRTSDGRVKRPGSANTLRSSVRCFFAWASAAGFARTNAAALVRRARVGLSAPKGLTPTERAALLAALRAGRGSAAKRDAVLFGLMIATGLRLGSALGLTKEDVDLDDGTIRVRTMKNGGTHEVYLPDALVGELREYLREHDGERLFPLCHRQVRRRLAVAAHRAGIQRTVSPHTLRHSFAIGLYERTSDIELVRAALGHASIASTSVYARATPAMVRQAVLRAVPAGP